MFIYQKDEIVRRRTNKIRDHTQSFQPGQRPREPSFWREMGALGIKVAVFAVIIALTFTFFYGFHRNTDPGMFPMVKDGDLVLFYRLDKNYDIGELLLLDFEGARQIRRVVAKEGDNVDITEDGLVVNGSLQQELAIYEETWDYIEGTEFPITVGPNEVFVLGDARQNAADSRIYGCVKLKNTLGKVITTIRRRNL